MPFKTFKELMNVLNTTKLSFEVISPHRVLDEFYCLENSEAPGYGAWIALRPDAFCSALQSGFVYQVLNFRLAALSKNGVLALDKSYKVKTRSIRCSSSLINCKDMTADGYNACRVKDATEALR